MKKKFTEVYNKCDSITLNVTNNCNLHCRYCFESDKKKSMMPPEIAVEAVKKTYRPLPNDKFIINFFGGEPLLNWEAIKAVIDYCDENNLQVTYGMTTNLTILTDEMLDYFDDHSMPILLSIDGTKDVHDTNRCNSYDTVIKNLKRLTDRGLGLYIEARMTIMPEQIKYTLQGIKELYDLGINNFCPIPVTDTEWNEESLEDARKFYRDVTDWFIGIMKDPKNTRNVSIKNVDDLMCNILLPEYSDHFMCPIFNNTWCTVDYKGDVYACHQGPTSKPGYKDTLCIGNLDYIDSDKIKNTIPKADYSKEKCKTCKGKAICKCGCPVENLRETGSWTKPTDAYCALQEIMVETISAKREELLNIEDTHNRILTMVKECLKIKRYVDQIYESTDLSYNNNIKIITQVLHLQEMVENMQDNLLPSFRDYIDDKLKAIFIDLLTTDNVVLDTKQNELKEDK